MTSPSRGENKKYLKPPPRLPSQLPWTPKVVSGDLLSTLRNSLHSIKNCMGPSQRTPKTKLLELWVILRFRGPFSRSCWRFLGIHIKIIWTYERIRIRIFHSPTVPDLNVGGDEVKMSSKIPQEFMRLKQKYHSHTYHPCMVCLSIDMLNVVWVNIRKCWVVCMGVVPFFNQMFGEGPAIYMGNFACFGSQVKWKHLGWLDYI